MTRSTLERTRPRTQPTPSPQGDRWLRLLYAGLLCLIVSGIFGYSVKIRQPWFGTLSAGHHQWLTGSTLKFTRNWYREGAWRLKFIMLENPRSVEFPTLASRGLYVSYPPGSLLPVYVLSRLSGQEPTPALVMHFNLANHLLIALLLALMAYVFLLQLGLRPHNALLFAVIPPGLELLLPAPLYWHQNVFGPDQAIILPVVLLLFLEVLRGSVSGRRATTMLAWVQGIVLFCGFLTEWYIVFVSLAIYLKRLIRGEVPVSGGFRAFFMPTLAFWAGPALATALFVAQVAYYHAFPLLIGRFLLRSGISAEGHAAAVHLYRAFWALSNPAGTPPSHMTAGYGAFATLLLWASLALFGVGMAVYLRRRRQAQPVDPRVAQVLAFCGMVLLPPFVQIYVFRNHSFVHDFSALKFATPLALVPFVIMPVLLALLFAPGLLPAPTDGKPNTMAAMRQAGRLVGLNLALILVAGIYLSFVHPRFREMFPPPIEGVEGTVEFLRNFGYHDVLFSYQAEIPANPPQMLAYTMKRVYLVHSPEEIRQFLARIPGESHGYLLTPDGDALEVK